MITKSKFFDALEYMTDEFGVEPLSSGYAYKQLTDDALNYPKEIEYKHVLIDETLGGGAGTITREETIQEGRSSEETISESVIRTVEVSASWSYGGFEAGGGATY